MSFNNSGGDPCWYAIAPSDQNPCINIEHNFNISVSTKGINACPYNNVYDYSICQNASINNGKTYNFSFQIV